MDASSAQTIERVMSLLGEMETNLDDVRTRAEEGRQRLISSARDEGDRAKNAILQEASKISEKKLRQIEIKAEAEAKKVLSKADADVKGLKKKAENVFDDAVQIVVKSLLALD
tara:strand:- start:2437 stop:2775 length:339 start_codon:yes stop_codon:yes gene_type:complete